MGAYQVCAAVAEQNLTLGRVVVAVAVNDSDDARETWRTAARQAQAQLCFVVERQPRASTATACFNGRAG